MRPPLTEQEQGQLILRTGKQAPLISAPSAGGQDVHLWQFKQRKHFALFFLHDSACERCRAIIADIAANRPRYLEQEAEPVVVLQEPVERIRAFAAESGVTLPLLADADGSRIRRYLSLAGGERAPLAVFLVDRYSTLWEQSVAQLHDELPSQADVLSWFGFINTRCTL
jgi:peroxiredoxin